LPCKTLTNRNVLLYAAKIASQLRLFSSIAANDFPVF
jgi:hypothetical protein